MAVEFESSKSTDGTVELTPLIDVIFQLLVFFMLSSSFLYPSLELILPELDETDPQTTPPMLVVNLDADGATFVNSEPVEMARLTEVLRSMLPEVEDRAVFLRADRRSEYATVLEIMRRSSAAGALQFHFLYEEAGDGP